MSRIANKCRFLLIAFLVPLLAASGCKSTPGPTGTTPTTSTSASSPTITIVSPGGGPIPVPGNVTVTVQVSNFNLVEKQGQANAPGEGHLHYYLDIDAPITPGQPAIPASGSWAHTAARTYTFTNVTGGQHKISVELVNNDHTPLVPPVVAIVNFLVLQEIGPPNLVIASPRDGDTMQAGDVTVAVQVNNFNVVSRSGPNVTREGHIHYFLDVDAPTTPGQPATPPSGAAWGDVATATFTFANVAPGTHTISVELVNNDHTPLQPPVVQKIAVNVVSAPTPTTTLTPTPVTLDLVAKGIAFNMTTITVPAGANVVINFANQDAGIFHNFSLFADSSATPPALFQGTVTQGLSTATYKFTAPTKPGTYFFRCDIHPTIMTGSFIVK